MKQARTITLLALLVAIGFSGCISDGIDQDKQDEEVSEDHLHLVEWEATCDFLIAARDNDATDQTEELYIEPAGSCSSALVERTQARNEANFDFDDFETPGEQKRVTTIRFQVEYGDGRTSQPVVVHYSANKNQEKQATAVVDVPSRGVYGTTKVCWYANALIDPSWWPSGWDIGTYGPQPDCYEMHLKKDTFL